MRVIGRTGYGTSLVIYTYSISSPRLINATSSREINQREPCVILPIKGIDPLITSTGYEPGSVTATGHLLLYAPSSGLSGLLECNNHQQRLCGSPSSQVYSDLHWQTTLIYT